MTKNLLFYLLFLSFTISLNGFSQNSKTHFDNKPYVEGEFLVQLKDVSKLQDLLKKAPAHFELTVQKELSPIMKIWLFDFNHLAVSHHDLQAWLYDQAEVSVADYNYLLELRSTVPDDTQFSDQWHHVNTGQTGGTADADIDSDLAWDITTGGTTATNDDIVVCMLESGNLDHVDIVGNRWINQFEIPDNGIDDDNNGYVDDYYGWNIANNTDDYGSGSHGTNCLGMIGAVGDNNLLVSGINWNVKLMVVQGYSVNNQASVVQAYNYPLTMRKKWNESNGTEGAFVVATSASWGLDGANPANYPLWCSFYDTLGYYGIINIGATTNSNLNVDQSGDMPTACASQFMVGVGRTDHNDNTAGGYGVTTIPLGAPGINVVTTAGTNGTTTTTGTSFACPLTAGVVGLAYSIPCPSFMSIVKNNPNAGAQLVLDALLDGVDVKPQLATKFSTSGRLNAKNTLDLLMEASCSSCIVNGISSSVSGTTVTINFTTEEDVDAVTLSYRPLNGSWQTVANVTSPHTLSDLLPCTLYEYKLTSTCDTETAESSVFTVQTKDCGACLDLEYCATKATGSTTVRLAYTLPNGVGNTVTNFVLPNGWAGNAASGYNYGQLVLANGSVGVSNLGCGTLSNAATINGNIAVAMRGECGFSEKAYAAQQAGATALIIINNVGTTLANLGSGTNANLVTIPVVMISQADGAALLAALNNGDVVSGLLGVQNEWIQSFEINGDVITSGDNNGYQAASNGNAIDLLVDETYAFTLTAGFGNQPLPERARVWLDLNQDGVFTTNELLYYGNVVTQQVTTGSITIPAAGLLGSTRMRVQLAYAGSGQQNAPDVCGEFTWGEVEDYCVNLQSDASVDQLAHDLEVIIYPNPAEDELMVNWSNASKISKLRIVDVFGKEVFIKEVKGHSENIDVTRFAPGSYFIELTVGQTNYTTTRKFVVR